MRGASPQRAANALITFKANGIAVKVCGRPLNNIESLGPLVRDLNATLKYSRIKEIDVLRNLTAMGTRTTAQEISFMGFHAIDASRPWDHIRFCSEGLYEALRTLLIVKRGPGLQEYLRTEKKFFHWANCAKTPVEKGMVIKVLIDALKQHDKATDDHNIGTASLAWAIAREMGLPEEEVSLMGLKALLHDIGKVGVPVDILHKASKLTENDWAQLRMHVKVGVYLLKKIRWMPGEAIDALLYHHYYKNYPEEMINPAKTPFDAKIIAVADSFDVMTTGRRKEYEIKRTPTQALRELKEDGRYDAAIVQALRKVVIKSRFGLIRMKKDFDPSEWFGLDPRKKLNRDELRRILF